jgi:hypothetical protein
MSRWSDPLRVSVVGLAFRAGLEAAETFGTARLLDPEARCVAVVPPSERLALQALWPAQAASALLLIIVEPDEALVAACDVLGSLPPGPVAVLLANPPMPTGALPQNRRLTTEVVRRLERCRPDVQVHLYSEDWLRRPPRVR